MSTNMQETIQDNVEKMPWLRHSWSQLRQYGSVHFPHALIIAAPAGYGKFALSQYLIQALLCQRQTDDGLLQPGCGQCQHCRLWQSRTYPDYRMLTLAEDKKQIGIDAVREQIEWLALSRQLAHKKILLIQPADSMNSAAANALLKTLEEPAAETVIILLAENSRVLLPTIRSRCQLLRIPRASNDEIAQWMDQQLLKPEQDPQQIQQWQQYRSQLLALAEGAPLKLRQLLTQENLLDFRGQCLADLHRLLQQDTTAVQVAEQWLKQKIEPKVIIDSVYALCGDLIRLQLELPQSLLYHPYLYERVQAMSQKLNGLSLFVLMQKILEYYRVPIHSQQPQLLLEDILLSWQKCRL